MADTPELPKCFCTERSVCTYCEDLDSRSVVPAPLTGPAMEAHVRACAEAVWRMYREPHNLTWNARKERTFEAILALLLSTHNPLLERIRELEADGNKLRIAYGLALELHGCGGSNCTEAEYLKDAEELLARAEAAEAKVRELEAAAGAARAEGIREARNAYEAHHHTAKRDESDVLTRECAKCGGDLMDDVHLRAGESGESRKAALLSEPKGASK